MIVNRERLKMAMARACMNTRDLAAATQMPRPTLNNAVVGKSISPATLGRIARALGVDPSELIEEMEVRK